MDFTEATKLYTANPTDENLEELSEKLMKEMTLKEKVRMLKGHAFMTTAVDFVFKNRFYNARPYAAGGCKRLKIPEVLFADGPRGVVLGHSTCFPVSMARGASFDDELEYEIGKVFAKEASAGGANYFAGICINLLRNPMWGRAQETYGEDPCLLGKMGVALTKAMQENGVIACPKHYAMNSIEDLRFSVNVKADKRTLYEVYLPHFKKCIDAGAMSVMGAYNKVNGTYCCENKELLTDILRNEWKFKGFVISDFVFGVYDAARSIKAGLDIEMPYIIRYQLVDKKLKDGEITESDIDRSVKYILNGLIKTLPAHKKYPESVILSPEHISLSRKAAEKGTVLLENKNSLLPLAKDTKIAVIGRYADRINVGDHGSSNVYSPYTVTAFEGISEKFGEENVCLYNGADPDKAMETAKDSDVIVVCAGSDYKQEGEFLINMGNIKKKPKDKGGDRTSLRLPPEDVRLIKALSLLGKKLVVNIMGGSAYIIEEWKDLADAVLMSFYSGLEGGNALASILCGDVNPGGKLPFTIAKREEDYPDFLHIESNGREINYGYYHGYTLFDKEEKEPAYPFGYGLSYTSFKLGRPKNQVEGNKVTVSLNVSNTGDKDGDQVIQLYVSSENKAADRPVKLLKDFRRVSIKAGEKIKAELSFDIDDIKFYNPDKNEWELDSSYKLYVGDSSDKLVSAGKISF